MNDQENIIRRRSTRTIKRKGVTLNTRYQHEDESERARVPSDDKYNKKRKRERRNSDKLPTSKRHKSSLQDITNNHNAMDIDKDIDDDIDETEAIRNEYEYKIEELIKKHNLQIHALKTQIDEIKRTHCKPRNTKNNQHGRSPKKVNKKRHQ